MKLKRVLMLRTLELPDPQGGGPVRYHGGHQFEMPPALADGACADGYAVPVVGGEPVFPLPPEPEPAAEEAEPELFALTEEVA